MRDGLRVLCCVLAAGCSLVHGPGDASLDAPDGGRIDRADVPPERDAPRDACGPRAEACDGRDDDCDGRIDEASCALSGAESRCVMGSCVLDRCVAGLSDCDGEPSTGCEVDVSSDRQNCGGCGVQCLVSEACQSGRCERERIVDLAVGAATVVVLESGRVVGWGWNEYAGLIPGGPERIMVPSELPHVPPSAAVAGFGATMCFLGSDGTVRCQGYNEYGACGTGAVSETQPLAAVELPGRAVSISRGHSSAQFCATLDDGSAWCWGGRCELVAVPTPFRQTLLEGVDASDWSERNQFVAVREGLLATGNNTLGELGLGTTGPGCSLEMSAPAVLSLPLGERVVELEAFGLLARSSSGHVLVWGDNDRGRLGEGPAPVASPTTPHVIPGLPPAVGIGAGAGIWCVLDDGGQVWCWGVRDLRDISYTPRAMSGLDGVTRLEMEGNGSCAVIGERSLRCWGQNRYGQVGNGTTDEVDVPVAPVGFE